MTDATIIKQLRDETGLSFDKIKKALDETGNDATKALELLKSQAGAIAAKKAERTASEGAIGAYVHNTGKVGALVQLACESDFVAINEDFKTLARDLAMHASAMRPADVTEMLAQQFIKDPEMSIQEVINQAIAKLGENIKLSDVCVFAIA